jgi:hypothetical protein
MLAREGKQKRENGIANIQERVSEESWKLNKSAETWCLLCTRTPALDESLVPSLSGANPAAAWWCVHDVPERNPTAAAIELSTTRYTELKTVVTFTIAVHGIGKELNLLPFELETQDGEFFLNLAIL